MTPRTVTVRLVARRSRFARLGIVARLVIGGALIVAALVVGAVRSDARPVVEPITSARMPACSFDDGSGTGRRPCVWDARHMGNGLGDSFVAIPVYPFRGTDPVIRYVSHHRAHRLAFGGVR